MSISATQKSYKTYQSNGIKSYHEQIYGGVSPRGYLMIANRRAAKLQTHILETDSVLEYGIGPGWNLACIKAKRRKGYDIAPAMRPFVEAQGIEFATEITRQDLTRFDVVICSHVLEHLLNPSEALTTIIDCMKPDGKALLYVPFDAGRRFKKYNPDEPNHHLYAWNVQSFANFIALHDLTIVEYKLRPFGYERIAAIWVERLNLPNWMYSILISVALWLRPTYEINFIVTKTDGVST